MENEGVKERLVAFLKYYGIGQAKFEKSIGASNGFVNNIRQSIQPDRLQKIAQLYPELNISWLLVGEALGGPMIKRREVCAEKGTDSSASLPLIPIEVFAGPGEIDYGDERVQDHYTVTDFKDSDFLLRVKGDSMTPKYNGGDLVACRRVPDVYYLQWGRVYCIYTKSQGAMIKRLQPSERDGWIKCVSENVKYAPFDVPMEDIVSVALVNGSISLE